MNAAEQTAYAAHGIIPDSALDLLARSPLAGIGHDEADLQVLIRERFVYRFRGHYAATVAGLTILVRTRRLDPLTVWCPTCRAEEGAPCRVVAKCGAAGDFHAPRARRLLGVPAPGAPPPMTLRRALSENQLREDPRPLWKRAAVAFGRPHTD